LFDMKCVLSDATEESCHGRGLGRFIVAYAEVRGHVIWRKEHRCRGFCVVCCSTVTSCEMKNEGFVSRDVVSMSDTTNEFC
jgi:hypothetical protein